MTARKKRSMGFRVHRKFAALLDVVVGSVNGSSFTRFLNLGFAHREQYEL